MSEAPLGQTPGAEAPPSSPTPAADRTPARVPEAPRSADVATAAPAGGSGTDGAPTGGSGQAAGGATGSANRRRRGSRGGRGRGRSGAAGQGGESSGAGESSGTPESTPVPARPGDAAPSGPERAATPGPTAGPVEGAAGTSTTAPPVAPPVPGKVAATPSGPGASAPTVAPAERPKIGDTRPSIGDTRPAPPGAAAPAPAQTPARSGGGRSRNRGARSGGGGGGGATTSAAVDGRSTGGQRAPAAPKGEVAAKGDGTSRGEGRRGGRERRGKAVGRYQICVHVRPEMTQIALLEGRTLVEHYISRASDDATQIDGNIYRGRVQNVLPGMEAAFIDIGTPKNAVLYHGDVRYDLDDVESSGKGGGQPRIEQLLKPGQTILCQVTKNPIGAKGARLTQEVSLPGRFVVLVPNSTAYGISKRLEDAERKRLRKIVDAVRPEGHGLIVRTAAAGASAEELGHDIGRLVEQWDGIAAASLKGQGAALLYREPAIAVRVIREELNREYRAVVIDDLALYEQVRDYVGAVNPELADRVEYYDPEAEALPIFERFHVHEQLHKALDRKVYLPSGGSLVIDRTEALTVIDVNTGKNVGTTNLEETVYRNNLEAADEVARQLRLRDIGGIIVIDFIDMEIRENRDKVGAALRTALARDKTRTQVFDISELGLVEMTRKRVSEGLIESMSTTCEVCEGRGIVFDDPDL
jgi:ribonuclease E